MCNPTAIAIVGTGLGLYGQKRQHDARKDAAERAREIQLQRIQNQTRQMQAQASAQRQQNQLQLAANANQGNIAQQAADTLRNRVQQDLSQPKKELDKLEGRQRGELDKVVAKDVATEAGEARQVGSNVKGRVSEEFSERGAQALERNVDRAERLAGQLATIGAFRQQPGVRGDKITQIALALTPYGRQAQDQAALDRIRVQGAGIVDPVPIESIYEIDPNSDSGAVLQGLGSGLMNYAGTFGGRRPGPYSPQWGNTGGTVIPHNPHSG